MLDPRHFCILLFFTSAIASGQTSQDFGLWGTVSYGSDINDDLDFSIDQEFRTESNATVLGVIFTNFGLDYRINRNFQVGWNYRFILNQRNTGVYGHRHRTMLDLQGRKQYKQWTFAYRMRGQWEIRTWNYANEYGFSPSTDLRNTFKTIFQLNRQLELYASFDLRILYRDPRIPDFQGIDRYRYRLGTEVLLAREKSLGIFFQHQREVNIPDREVEFIIGLEYKFGSRRPIMDS